MKKRILFRIQNLAGGGAEKSLVILLSNLDYSKYEIDLLLNDKTGIYLNRVPGQVGLYHIGKGATFLEKAWRKFKTEFYRCFPYFLYKFILKSKIYDIEVAFLETSIPYIINARSNSKKIGWIHLDLNTSKEICRKKDQILTSLDKMDRLIVVSKQLQGSLHSLLPNLRTPVQVIYNPINSKEVIRKAQEKPIKKKKNQKLGLVSVGRLASQKGFDRLLNVCGRLAKEDHLSFKLSILGEGPDRDKLTDQIRRLDLNEYVELIGYKPNPYPYISSADIYVMSSHVEGLPYVILEALILNKPIVSTDVTGPRELLKNGQWGLLVENSEEGLYNGLKKMITDKTFRESFTKKEKDFSPFDPQNIARQLENMMDSLLSPAELPTRS